MEKKNWCVYRHTFPNGKMYIGVTGNNPWKRWANGYGYCGQQEMFEAVIKYGWRNVRHEIVADCLSEIEARRMEKELVEAAGAEKLYNGMLFANGRKAIKKKDKLDYVVGDGTYYSDLRQLMTSEQESKFFRKVDHEFPFVDIRSNCVHVHACKVRDNIIYISEFEAYYPECGVTYREFGDWIANKAEFVRTHYVEGEFDESYIGTPSIN